MASLSYFQHRDGGAIHGFTLPLPAEIEAQVRTGKLVPVDAPPVPRTLELPPAMVEQVLAEESRLSKKKKRAELLAALAELGDDDEDEDRPQHTAPAPASSPAAGLPELAPGIEDLDEPFGSPHVPPPASPRADGLTHTGGGTSTKTGRPRSGRGA